MVIGTDCRYNTLIDGNDIMSAYIGKWLWEEKETTGSTNDDAVLLSATKTGEPFIISARTQTKGRGRRGRKWIAADGNLFFSQALPVDVRFLGQIVCLSAVSLWETVAKLLPSEYLAQIKWPNDVLIDNCKLSGTLLEKGENGYWVIGIGVNICVTPVAVELLYPATCLKDKGINIDRLAFLRSYIENFDNNYTLWQREGFTEISKKWLSAVKGLNEKITVRTDKETIEGIFTGIGGDGELLLTDNGKVRRIYAGDVFYIEKDKTNE